MAQNNNNQFNNKKPGDNTSSNLFDALLSKADTTAFGGSKVPPQRPSATTPNNNIQKPTGSGVRPSTRPLPENNNLNQNNNFQKPQSSGQKPFTNTRNSNYNNGNQGGLFDALKGASKNTGTQPATPSFTGATSQNKPSATSGASQQQSSLSSILSGSKPKAEPAGSLFGSKNLQNSSTLSKQNNLNTASVKPNQPKAFGSNLGDILNKTSFNNQTNKGVGSQPSFLDNKPKPNNIARETNSGYQAPNIADLLSKYAKKPATDTGVNNQNKSSQTGTKPTSGIQPFPQFKPVFSKSADSVNDKGQPSTTPSQSANLPFGGLFGGGQQAPSNDGVSFSGGGYSGAKQFPQLSAEARNQLLNSINKNIKTTKNDLQQNKGKPTTSGMFTNQGATPTGSKTVNIADMFRQTTPTSFSQPQQKPDAQPSFLSGMLTQFGMAGADNSQLQQPENINEISNVKEKPKKSEKPKRIKNARGSEQIQGTDGEARNIAIANILSKENMAVEQELVQQLAALKTADIDKVLTESGDTMDERDRSILEQLKRLQMQKDEEGEEKKKKRKGFFWIFFILLLIGIIIASAVIIIWGREWGKDDYEYLRVSVSMENALDVFSDIDGNNNRVPRLINPGDSFPLKIVARNSNIIQGDSGSLDWHDAYVRFTIWLEIDGTRYDNFILINPDSNSWHRYDIEEEKKYKDERGRPLVTADDGYYYYKGILPVNQQVELISSIKFSARHIDELVAGRVASLIVQVEVIDEFNAIIDRTNWFGAPQEWVEYMLNNVVPIG